MKPCAIRFGLAIIAASTWVDDLLGNLRDPKPDRGALELGGMPSPCSGK